LNAVTERGWTLNAGEEESCQEEGEEESEEEVAFLLYPINGERRGTWSPGDIHQAIRARTNGTVTDNC
jgi:hypothetical protein